MCYVLPYREDADAEGVLCFLPFVREGRKRYPENPVDPVRSLKIFSGK